MTTSCTSNNSFLVVFGAGTDPRAVSAGMIQGLRALGKVCQAETGPEAIKLLEETSHIVTMNIQIPSVSLAAMRSGNDNNKSSLGRESKSVGDDSGVINRDKQEVARLTRLLQESQSLVATKERECEDLRQKFGTSLKSVRTLHSHQSKMFKDFVLLRERYDKLKTVLGGLLWNYLPANCAEFDSIPRTITAPEFLESETQIGPYALGAPLGEGQFSVVRLAKRIGASNGSTPFTAADVSAVPASECDLAVKVMKKAMLTEVPLLRHLANELRCLSELRHPGILQLIDVVHTPRHVYLVTPRGGKDLFDFFETHPTGVGEERAKVFVRGIADAVAHCHARRICHRDLKPENILLEADERRTTIIDFGFSRKVPVGARLTDFCGSAGFFAPEMLQEGSYDGFSADVWSVGCVMLELVLGSHKFGKLWMEAYNINNLVDPVKFTACVEKVLPVVFAELEKDCVSPQAIALLRGLLVLTPEHRIPVERVLTHPWLTGEARAGGAVRVRRVSEEEAAIRSLVGGSVNAMLSPESTSAPATLEAFPVLVGERVSEVMEESEQYSEDFDDESARNGGGASARTSGVASGATPLFGRPQQQQLQLQQLESVADRLVKSAAGSLRTGYQQQPQPQQQQQQQPQQQQRRSEGFEDDGCVVDQAGQDEDEAIADRDADPDSGFVSVSKPGVGAGVGSGAGGFGVGVGGIGVGAGGVGVGGGGGGPQVFMNHSVPMRPTVSVVTTGRTPGQGLEALMGSNGEGDTNGLSALTAGQSTISPRSFAASRGLNLSVITAGQRQQQQPPQQPLVSAFSPRTMAMVATGNAAALSGLRSPIETRNAGPPTHRVNKRAREHEAFRVDGVHSLGGPASSKPFDPLGQRKRGAKDEHAQQQQQHVQGQGEGGEGGAANRSRQAGRLNQMLPPLDPGTPTTINARCWIQEGKDIMSLHRLDPNNSPSASPVGGSPAAKEYRQIRLTPASLPPPSSHSQSVVQFSDANSPRGGSSMGSNHSFGGGGVTQQSAGRSAPRSQLRKST